MMTNNEIKNALAHNAMHITFTKKDGTERKMFCTADWDTLNKNSDDFEWEAPKGSRPLPENMVRVWDMEKMDWRCVNLDTVTEAEIDA